jgi:hypothetical protein
VGDVVVRGGASLIDRGAEIGRDLSAKGAESIEIGSGGGQRPTIGRDLTIVDTGAAVSDDRQNFICDAVVGRDFAVEGSVADAASWVIGDTTSTCTVGGNTIGGDILVALNANATDVADNQVDGGLTIHKNLAQAVVSANHAGADAMCAGNTPDVVGVDNTAVGDNRCPTAPAGRLVVSIAGLPSSAAAAVSVTGPYGYARTLTESANFEQLIAGTYDVAASSTEALGNRYVATVSATPVHLGAGETESIQVAYAIAIKPDAGITVTGPESQPIKLIIPADAFPGGATLQIADVASPDPNASTGAVGPAFSLDGSTEPSVPVEFDVPYSPAVDGSSEGVQLGWWSDDTDSWRTVPTTYDAARGVLVAYINHFSIWSWLKKQVTGLNTDIPTCAGPAPSWATINDTASGQYGIAASCAGQTLAGDLQVRVQSSHSGSSYVIFQEDPSEVTLAGREVTLSQVAGGWYALVPDGVTLEADFAEPVTRFAARLPLYGYAGEDGVSYIYDVLNHTIGLAGIPLDATSIQTFLASTFAACNPQIISAIADHTLAQVEAVVGCFVNSALEAGFDSAVQIAMTSVFQGAFEDKMAEASFWLNVAKAGRDFAEAVYAAGRATPVIDATLVSSVVPPSLTVTETSFTPGTTIHVSGSNFGPQEAVALSLDGVTLGAAQTDENGNFENALLMIPTTETDGLHTLSVSGQTTGLTAEASLDVLASGSGGGSSGNSWSPSSTITVTNEGDVGARLCGGSTIDNVILPSGACATQTSYGIVWGGDQLELNGSGSFVPLSPLILPVPNSPLAFTFSTKPWGVYLFYYPDLAAGLTPRYDGSGNLYRYDITQPSSGEIKDAADQPVDIFTDGMTITGNSRWLVADSPFVSKVIVNLQTFDVFKFGLPTDYSLGLAPNYRFAASDDGRYVAEDAAFGNLGLDVEDLSNCTSPPPGQIFNNYAVTGNQCQTLDLTNAVRAALPTVKTIVPQEFSSDGSSFVVRATYQDASGILHTAKLVISSST